MTTTTTKEKNIFQKLLQVKRSVDFIKKANQGMQYSYVSSSNVIIALRDAMNNEGLLLIPQVVESSNTTRENKKGHTVYFTELKIKFTWLNTLKPDEKIDCFWYGQGIDIEGEKGVGKALTYAEKYFLLKFFNIPTDKDDPDSFQEKPKAVAANKNELQEKIDLVNEFMKLSKQYKIKVSPAKQKILKDYKNQSLGTLTDLVVALNVHIQDNINRGKK